jgi:MSHA biogenesis protein MshK
MVADMRRAYLLPALCFASCAFAPAHGQAFTDPTRPPDVLRTPAAGDARASAPARLSSPPVVILSGDRSRVTINGQTVLLGGRIGDARVTRISDTEVVLQSATGTETIRLYGAIDKKAIAARPTVSTGMRSVPTEADK